MSAYYNEFDPNAAMWLRELIKDGQIADGEVDERSIVDVTPEDIRGFTQVHMFAGIGIWSYALRLAGWPDDRPVWSGSPPCQPWSSAGSGNGFADERHLWPTWHRLIRACQPDVIFGEQVGSAAAIGKVNRKNGQGDASRDGWSWVDHVYADLEAACYAVGTDVAPCCSIGAPHIRQRLYFVADLASKRLEGATGTGLQGQCDGLASSSASGVMGDDQRTGLERYARYVNGTGRGGDGSSGPIAETGTRVGRLGQSDGSRSQSRGEAPSTMGLRHSVDTTGCGTGVPGPTNGFWGDADWLWCRDGKWRPVESGSFPLVDEPASGMVPSGDPSRTYSEVTKEERKMRLKGYGNAIVAHQAASWVRVYMSGV